MKTLTITEAAARYARAYAVLYAARAAYVAAVTRYPRGYPALYAAYVAAASAAQAARADYDAALAVTD